MLESSITRSETRCEQCSGLKTLAYDVVANGISRPIAITDRGGKYTITWVLGNNAPAPYSPCTCSQSPGDVQGEFDYGTFGKHVMRPANAWKTLGDLEEMYREETNK